MTIKSIQKVIKVGSSAGVTIPAKDMKYADIEVGDEVEVTIVSKKAQHQSSAENDEIIETAKDILARYKEDFDNLAQRWKSLV